MKHLIRLLTSLSSLPLIGPRLFRLALHLGWNPTYIPGCTLWLKPDAAILDGCTMDRVVNKVEQRGIEDYYQRKYRL